MCLKYHLFNCPSFTNINLFTGMVTKYTKYSTIRIFIRLKKKKNIFLKTLQVVLVENMQ